MTWCLQMMPPCCVALGWFLIWVVSPDWVEELCQFTTEKKLDLDLVFRFKYVYSQISEHTSIINNECLCVRMTRWHQIGVSASNFPFIINHLLMVSPCHMDITDFGELDSHSVWFWCYHWHPQNTYQTDDEVTMKILLKTSVRLEILNWFTR